jgi:hypothetical protein
VALLVPLLVHVGVGAFIGGVIVVLVQAVQRLRGTADAH